MLSYLARSLPLMVRARMREDGRLVSRLPQRVRLAQIDLNGHMNQAVYFQVMELGRVDCLLRSGAWRSFQAARLRPVVAAQSIVYRRELKPRQRYEMDTRMVGFDGRLLVFEAHLVVEDRVHAKGEAKLIFSGDDGVISAEATRAACERFLAEPLVVEQWRVVRDPAPA